jgi:multidrug efflux system membrane fusion protein
MDIRPPPLGTLRTRHPVPLLSFGVAALAVLVLIGFALTYFGKDIRANEPKAGRGPASVPVSVASVALQTVPLRLQAIGNVEPFATVAVKARVDGQIVQVGFKEGEEVKKDQILFKIDPRPFEAALRQAEANYLRDTAQKDQARSQERRYQELLQKNFVSKEAYAQIRTNAETADAVALASSAALDNAKLNVEYCTIRAPIEGYAGKIQIQLGNLVKANDVNPLVIVNQVHPIYVTFSVPEQRLPEVRAHNAAAPLAVDALQPGGEKTLASGTLVFIDNAVDPNTGTIRLRARFANRENALWPGQFVNLGVMLYQQKDAIVVPTKAVQTGPNGQYVFVVKSDMTVEMRAVTVERTEGESTIIRDGLRKDEQVVTQGQLRLGPGAKVAIKS